MKFIYGKQEFNTLSRGQENCYLLTNGLGGFSSVTMIGSASRNDHALFMAAVTAPNHRKNLVHRLSERLFLGQRSVYLSSQEFVDKDPEEGYKFQSAFSFCDVPIWQYQVGGVAVEKTVSMAEGANTVAVEYTLENRDSVPVSLVVTPLYQFTSKGHDQEEGQQYTRQGNTLSSAGVTLYFETNGSVEDIEPLQERLFYEYDRRDGRRDSGSVTGVHQITLSVPPGGREALHIVYSTSPIQQSAEMIHAGALRWRQQLEAQADFCDPIAKMLSKSANQFLSYRESTGCKTILAGYPFFEDWGRDTMIALPGCALSTGQFDAAREILQTFLQNEHHGLMPNLFPEGANAPAYNTVDAALLFINCVYLYHQRTGDTGFLAEAFPVMERIIKSYRRGTDYAIAMDSDGLISAGAGLDQVTWMDIRVGEILPTPRHGKPVEINAYWYNALRIMDSFAAILGEEGDYLALSEQVKASFCQKFWCPEIGCLRDVLSHSDADLQIRCNQIWAVSMPFTMLPREQERAVVETVYRQLYTPYGLRTLSPDDPQFRPFYGGEPLERDLSYHQGTVWPFPLGAYYLAYLKVHDYSEAAIETVKRQLAVLEGALREGCVGQLPEIYDGMEPAASKGCFAQAWSVGELLRVYEMIERPH